MQLYFQSLCVYSPNICNWRYTVHLDPLSAVVTDPRASLTTRLKKYLAIEADSKTKSETRSTQISKTKHAKRETCSPFIKHETVPCQVTNADTAGIKHDLTNRMQFKTIQVELRGVANAIPPPSLNLKSDEDWLPFSLGQ